MKNYGLIFVDNDTEVYLGEFVNETIREFRVISDFDEVYLDLATTDFSVVEITMKSDSVISLKDIGEFTPYTQHGDIVITDLLKAENFPSEHSDKFFKIVYQDILKHYQKP